MPDGAALLDRLKRLGITGWNEPLLCLPKGHLDYSRAKPVRDAIACADIISEPQIFSLVVSGDPSIVANPKRRIILTATDGMFSVRIVVFVVQGVDVGLWKDLRTGQRLLLRGVLQNWNGALQMTGPTMIDPSLIGKIVPVYEKRRGVVADGAIFAATRFALEHHLDASVAHIIDSFKGLSEAEILARAKLKAPSIETVLRAAHAPSSPEEAECGLLAMRRLTALTIVENARRMKSRSPVEESAITIPNAILHELAARLPYPLTNDQRSAIREIVADIASPLPMRRVLSGDVGTGKTVCLMIPALAIQRLGKRAVILTPNALLAHQFVKECKAYYGDETNVLAVTATAKKVDLSDNPILVGTTALLARLKGEPAPALLMVDEEQKLSVGQKMELGDTASNYLQATATPIPRTTALITHGAMAVSIIRQAPVEKEIATHLVMAGEAKRLFDHTRRVLDMGGQVAIVYPLVKDEGQEKKSVVAAYEEWNRRFPGQVAMVHGQMKEAEKMAAIDGLKAGHQKIAIASSIVELGLTLPSLRSLIVVNAERYGTSTLHQLRGRVARHGGKGWFFLFCPDPPAPETRQRLQLLVDHADGFTLSEQDAELRGYGDLFEEAERQSGNSRSTVFRCVDLTPAEIHAVASMA